MPEEDALSPTGGDGVRALTSTTLRVIADNDAAIEEEDTAVANPADTVGEAAEATPSRGVVSHVDGGDEDRDRGATSTTFKADEDKPATAVVVDEFETVD